MRVSIDDVSAMGVQCESSAGPLGEPLLATVPKSQSKDERLNLRVDSATKALIEQAAALTPERDVTSFVLGVTVPRAKQVISEYEATLITAENRKRFYDLLANPPAPSESLQALFYRADDRFRLVQ